MILQTLSQPLDWEAFDTSLYMTWNMILLLGHRYISRRVKNRERLYTLAYRQLTFRRHYSCSSTRYHKRSTMNDLLNGKGSHD